MEDPIKIEIEKLSPKKGEFLFVNVHQVLEDEKVEAFLEAIAPSVPPGVHLFMIHGQGKIEIASMTRNSLVALRDTINDLLQEKG